jgi:NADH-quinone oxidoreductase subunit C
MNISEIHTELKAKFGEAVFEMAELKGGLPFIKVKAEELLGIAKFLKDAPEFSFDYLRIVSGLDLGDRLACVYHLYSYKHQHELTLRVELDRTSPKVSSLCSLWPIANWLERETYDMLGIVFEGHPYLKRILLPADWEGYPLRKDYKQPDTYHGLKHE